jgi:hypothetical protein
MQTLFIPECLTCGSARVERLPRIMSDDLEEWFECDSCRHVFAVPVAEGDQEVPEGILDMFSCSELSADDYGIVASLRRQHRIAR